MNLNDMRHAFNRALKYTFSPSKTYLVFAVLAMSGLLAVFFRGLASHANLWASLSLLFVPLFIAAGILLSVGILLIRIYHDEIKGKPVQYKDVLSKSWELVIGASYFSLPIILAYLLLWMLLGVFMMLRAIPGIGEFFGAILSFAPFLINFLMLVLAVLNFALLFFVAPILALNGMNRHLVTEVLTKRWNYDIFSNLFLAVIALLPLLVVLSLLILSAVITGSMCVGCDNPYLTVMEWFFVMIPFTALLSPAVIFFFNFAAESHVLLMREVRDTQ
ncbi:MAG: hypothetical protein KDK62_07155 [Chlamydiia bacterium]|nr:hypothetical protein [Chlamydiia bacterium]